MVSCFPLLSNLKLLQETLTVHNGYTMATSTNLLSVDWKYQNMC